LPCLVAELLEGEDLSSLGERMKKLPVGVAITICRQICRGLSAAHAVGVVHRDLKPSNVFLVRRPDERIQIKILDFGVAKIADERGLTRTGVVVGTPSYMSPEQARGSANVDARAQADVPKLAVYARSGSGFVEHLNMAGPAARVAPPSMDAISRAKGARPAALGLAVTVGVVAGASVFVVACAVVLLLAGRPN